MVGVHFPIVRRRLLASPLVDDDDVDDREHSLFASIAEVQRRTEVASTHVQLQHLVTYNDDDDDDGGG